MKVSVITPLYHGAVYLKGLLSMIEANAQQLDKAGADGFVYTVEYILVNDAPEEVVSADWDVCSRTQVKLITNAQNFGIHRSRVNGLSVAEGAYILFLDQDDEIASDCLSRLLTKAAADPSADVIVSNGYRKMETDGGVTLSPLYQRKAAMRSVPDESMYLYGTDMIFSPGQCLIKRSAIPKEWESNIVKANGCDDFLLWLLMFQRGRKFVTIPDYLYYHRETDQNVSNSSENMAASYYEVCDILERMTGYSQHKVKTLRRRYHYKEQMKSETSGLKKLYFTVSNPDIAWKTINYKIRGYH